MAVDDYLPEFPPLPPAVEALVRQIRYNQVDNRRLETSTREKLAQLGEDESLAILRQIATQRIQKSFDGFIIHLINKKRKMAAAAAGGSPPFPNHSPTAAGASSSSFSYPSPIGTVTVPSSHYCSPSAPVAASPSYSSPSAPVAAFPSYSSPMAVPISPSSDSSPFKRSCLSPAQSPQQQMHSPSPSPTKLGMNVPYYQVTPQSLSPPSIRAQPLAPCKLDYDDHDQDQLSPGAQSLVPCKLPSSFQGCRATVEDLRNIEFRKAFLILNYLGRYKLDDVMTADGIRQLGDLTMREFEAAVWSSVGQRCLGEEKNRVKSVDWNPKKPHVYHCIVMHNHRDGRLNITFKGPYVANMRNFLQMTLGDDNVLLVKFGADQESGADLERDKNNRINCDDQTCRNRHASIINDGIRVGPHLYRFFVFKDGQKEEKKKEDSKKDPTASSVKCYFIRVSEDCSMNCKSIRQTRSLFMNVDTLPSPSNYMARFSLILSKSKKLNFDLAGVTVWHVKDIPCKDKDNKLVKDKKGNLRIHTDGTGFISEDIAMRCPNVFQGRCTDSDIGQNQDVNFSDFRLRQPPLLMQLRLFYNGNAIKGTLLLNKKLAPKTIIVRDSMVKVYQADKLPGYDTANSLEIVNTSRQPRPAVLSRNLIALLTYGDVPREFFMDLLSKALDDARAVVYKRRAAARAASFPYEREMIACEIPLEESYLKFRLPSMMSDEKKMLRVGKIPLSDSYYLMGTADPTGVLKKDEVCVILDSGQVSGKVLVYRNPGLHFGDIHILNAVYVKEMEDYVGNAKFGIFFPTQGERSLADEMAGGDYDGDMFFVSRNPELLESFKESARWDSHSSPSKEPSKKPKKKPKDMPDGELETELFKSFWSTRFHPSPTMGMAAECWQVMMDELLTLKDAGECDSTLMENIKRVIDVYYDALDAPKTGDEVLLPPELKVKSFPHYMEKKKSPSYPSKSILGAIYDEVKKYEERDEMPVTEILKLPCFAEKAPDHLLKTWEKHYGTYKHEMSLSCKNEATKNEAADAVILHYRKIFYGPTGDFHTSEKRNKDLFEEARAIYQVVYDHAEKQRLRANGVIKEQRNAITKCGFAWKVAGTALCALYISSTPGEKPMLCSTSGFKEIFG